MGGPRITQSQKSRMRELRTQGKTFKEISEITGISIYAAKMYTSDIVVETEPVLHDDETVIAIDGYGEGYFASSKGRIFSTRLAGDLRPLKIHPSKKGGYKVSMHTEVGTKLVRVDHLVAGCFHADHAEGETDVVHLDGNILNNCAENLSWRKPVAPERKSRKALSREDAEVVRNRWLYGDSVRDIARDYDVSYATVFKELDGLVREVPAPPSEPGEEWVPISDYEDRYLVSSHGRIYSTGLGRRRPRLMVPYTNRGGYKVISLTNDEGSRSYAVHRLVACEFVDGYSSARNIVNHKDGDPTNNHADNLEWCTPQENTKHAIDVLGHQMGGSKPFETRSQREVPVKASHVSPSRRFTDDQVRSIRSDPRSARQLSKLYGVNKCTIINIRRGFTYTDVD